MDPRDIEDMRVEYQTRRDALINGLRSVGWKIDSPKASFYVWAKVPSKFSDSMSCARAFLEQADIVVTPGIGFGKSGEGYVRMSLTLPTDRIHEAVSRLSKIV
jgi:LL-diaminopimelate aminotransferase